MTPPIQEPSTPRSISSLAWGESQLFRRPAPVSEGGANHPWAWLDGGGATNAPDSTWMPVTWPEAAKNFDPGDLYYDWSITDSGDPGNDRFQIRLKTRGIYLISCLVSFDQVTTPNPNDGYAVLNVQQMQSNGVSLIEEWRESNQWNAAADSTSEMSDNPYLLVTAQAFVFNNLPNIILTRAKQTTGDDKGLNGIGLKIFYLDDLGPPADWVDEFV